MRKEDFDVMHFRIRPKSSRPKAFWSASGCHYQMCVGPDGSGHVCGVNFTHATRQKATGSGQYLPAVLKILKDLNPPPNTFGEPQKKGRDGSEYLVYECGYRPSIKDHLYIPIDQAAKDLAWLIESTLPKFLAIPDAC